MEGLQRLVVTLEQLQRSKSQVGESIDKMAWPFSGKKKCHAFQGFHLKNIKKQCI